MSQIIVLLFALLSTLTAPSGAHGQTAAPPEGFRRDATVIMSRDEGSRRFQEEWGYADAVAAGGFVFVSGVVASLRQGETDLKLAYTRAFEDIAQSLGRLRCSWGMSWR